MPGKKENLLFRVLQEKENLGVFRNSFQIETKRKKKHSLDYLPFGGNERANNSRAHRKQPELSKHRQMSMLIILKRV